MPSLPIEWMASSLSQTQGSGDIGFGIGVPVRLMKYFARTLIVAMAPPCTGKWATDAESFTADWFEPSQENKMVNITRFNPLEGALENWFRSVPVWLPSPETRAPAPTQFRMDVTENDNEYQVLADLPGIRGRDQHNY